MGFMEGTTNQPELASLGHPTGLRGLKNNLNPYLTLRWSVCDVGRAYGMRSCQLREDAGDQSAIETGVQTAE